MIYLIRWLYAGLLWLYPRRFRAEFAAEMQQVFAQVLADATARGPSALFAVCGRELFGVLVGGLAARARAARVALWGSVLPPDTFSLEATLRRLLRLPMAVSQSRVRQALTMAMGGWSPSSASPPCPVSHQLASPNCSRPNRSCMCKKRPG